MSSEVERLKSIKAQLVNCIQGQMGQLDKTDTKEMGEAIDMVKDMSESIYYCTITEAMEKGEKQQGETVNNINYYTSPMGYNKIYPDYYRDMERNGGYMYYPGTNGFNNSSNNMSSTNGRTSYYSEIPYDMRRDPREGRAAIRRRMYMEGKQMHNDTNSQLHELEAYLQQLSSDITQMIKDASPEEKATLHQKMTTLANKIV